MDNDQLRIIEKNEYTQLLCCCMFKKSETDT